LADFLALFLAERLADLFAVFLAAFFLAGLRLGAAVRLGAAAEELDEG
jgi:hypothetical protein